MRIRLYGLLRDAAERQIALEMDVCEGETVGSLIDRLVAKYPRMRPLLFERPGVLYRHVMIVINGRDIRHERGLETPVRPDDDMAIFRPTGHREALTVKPRIHGGVSCSKAHIGGGK